MTRYSVQPRDQIFVKGCELLSFAKNMGKNTGKNRSKNLSAKHSPKLIDQAKQSTTDCLQSCFRKTIVKTGNQTA